MSFCSHTWINKTRKYRRCVWCNKDIPAGSACRKDSGTLDGDFYTGHLHPECAAAYDSLTPRDWNEMDNQYTPGDFTRGRADDQRFPAIFSNLYRGKDLLSFILEDGTP